MFDPMECPACKNDDFEEVGTYYWCSNCGSILREVSNQGLMEFRATIPNLTEALLLTIKRMK